MKVRQKVASKPNIPTASMGDIAFLIIIFFMTTSIFTREKGLKMVLPEKGDGVKIKKENILTISVNPKGEVLLGDKIVTINDVRPRVAEELSKNKELVVVLKVARTAQYKAMIDVFDELKMAKAERISLMPVKEEGLR